MPEIQYLSGQADRDIVAESGQYLSGSAGNLGEDISDRNPMPDTQIDLMVGGDLQMEVYLNGKTSRYCTSIIGFLEGQSIIVRTPSVGGNCILLREGLPVKGRLLAGNRVYGFSTRISTAPLKPYPHVHLDFPAEFESLQIREVERVSTCIPVEVVTQADGKDVRSLPVELIDIGARGALIRAPEEFAAVDDVIGINCMIDYEGEETALKIPATIRNVRRKPCENIEGDFYLFGVQFNLKSHKDMLVVQGFVYETILKNRT